MDISPWFALNETDSCSDNNFAKDTSSSPIPIGFYSVNVFDFCVAFAAISATYHFVIVFMPGNVEYIESWENPLRWVDYGLSTPLMGVVLYSAYGIRSFNALVLQGIGFTGLQMFGALIEVVNTRIVEARKTPKPFVTKRKFQVTQFSLIFVAFGILGTLFAPLFLNMELIRKADRGNHTEITASPPPAVTAFTAVILLFYVLFGACSMFSVYKAFKCDLEDTAIQTTQYQIDKAYGACSVMAKTVLHWGLAFVVLAQDEMIIDTNFKDPHIACTPPLDEGRLSDFAYLGIITGVALLFGALTLSIETPTSSLSNKDRSGNGNAKNIEIQERLLPSSPSAPRL